MREARPDSELIAPIIDELRAENAELKSVNKDLGYTSRRLARERDAALLALEEARSRSTARLLDDVGGARAMIAESHAVLARALRVAQ